MAWSQTTQTLSPNLAKQPTLFVVGYAHLDTQWRWEYPQVIREFLRNTMLDNFSLFQHYPDYVFNFTGANRYRMMKEYYPADYARLKQYVAAGRWFPAGSSMEENDVNSPSPESIIRQVLYGNEYFRRDFGKTSAEYMLPDCFGFPASLPSILAHSGVKGFSTQKLTWGSSAPVGGPDSPEDTPTGTPFNVGIWQGPDGRGVIAALNPGSYGSRVDSDLSHSQEWLKRVYLDGRVSGVFADYHYYGTGDTGGSPTQESVANVEKSVRGNGPLRVISSTAEQIFLDITPGEAAHLPRYKGDLELTNHSAGSLTSEAAHKCWNCKNELLADAAEKASVAAAWLGGRTYPMERLNNAWALVLGGQSHDIMAGTATPQAYEYSWNDDVLAMNQFADVLTSATSAIAAGMNTEAKGSPVVVYNPLSIAREDVVEANGIFPGGTPRTVRVIGPGGKAVPAQVDVAENGAAKVVFLAKVPSVSFAVYDVQASAAVPASQPASELRVTNSSLENARYRVRLDQNGDVSSILDKRLNRELLSGSARLAFQTEKPEAWPAWNMDWSDQQKPPRGYVQGPAKIRVLENGPARVAVQVERDAEGSHFVQIVRLAAGDAGNRVEFANLIDWRSKEAALKATFPLTASNPEATYNWGIGTIQRGKNDPKKFEVAAHWWFDLTDRRGAYGVTMLSDCKLGSDKPDDSTLRLTLLYTPGISKIGRLHSDQSTQDWGRHEILYGLAAHAGNWRQGETDWQAIRLNDPLLAFTSAKHAGPLGKIFSLLRVDNNGVRIMAVKKAEDGNEVIVRLVEVKGRPQHEVQIAFAAPLTAAREVNGQEQALGKALVRSGALLVDFGPYQPRTFAVMLAAPRAKVPTPRWQAVRLTYDRSVASQDNTKSVGGFDASGQSLAAEMLPQMVEYSDIRFQLVPAQTGKPDALVTRGQKIPLPADRFNRVYVLAASADGDQKATFHVDNKPVELTVEHWGGFIGQWDDRTWNITEEQETIPQRWWRSALDRGRFPTPPKRIINRTMEYTGLKPAFIKRAPVAWFASHRHTADGANEPYQYSYLFAYAIDLPANARTLTLPDNDKIRVLAVTVADESGPVRPACLLYGTVEPTMTAGDSAAVIAAR